MFFEHNELAVVATYNTNAQYEILDHYLCQQRSGFLWARYLDKLHLEPEERKVLRRVFSHSPALKQAYALREDLTNIFDLPISKPIAQRKLRT